MGTDTGLKTHLSQLLRRPVVVAPTPVELPPKDEQPLPLPESWPNNTAKIDNRSYSIFFICGYMRSGTNWTERLLNLHQKINCRGEFHFEMLKAGLDRFVEFPWQMASDGPVREVAEACFQDAVRRCIVTIARDKPKATWIGDRTPRRLDAFLPGAPHFWVVRDGRDVLVSFTYHMLNVGGPHVTDGPRTEVQAFRECLAPEMPAYNMDPEHFLKHPERLLKEQWVDVIVQGWASRMRRDLDMFNKMRSGQVDARVCMVRFERMHAESENQRRQMYRFLGLDPAAAQPLSEASYTVPARGVQQIGSPIRRGLPGEWRNYFSDDTKRWFRRIAGKELIELGYERDDDW